MGAGETAYGKTVSELQTGVSVGDSEITGTLHYVTGYTGFNASEVSEQSGNFLALDFSSEQWPDTLKVEVVGGTKGPVTLNSEDHFCVFRIANKSTQKVKVTAEASGKTPFNVTYDLSKLVCESEE